MPNNKIMTSKRMQILPNTKKVNIHQLNTTRLPNSSPTTGKISTDTSEAEAKSKLITNLQGLYEDLTEIGATITHRYLSKELVRIGYEKHCNKSSHQWFTNKLLKGGISLVTPTDKNTQVKDYLIKLALAHIIEALLTLSCEKAAKIQDATSSKESTAIHSEQIKEVIPNSATKARARQIQTNNSEYFVTSQTELSQNTASARNKNYIGSTNNDDIEPPTITQGKNTLSYKQNFVKPTKFIFTQFLHSIKNVGIEANTLYMKKELITMLNSDNPHIRKIGLLIANTKTIGHNKEGIDPRTYAKNLVDSFQEYVNQFPTLSWFAAVSYNKLGETDEALKCMERYQKTLPESHRWLASCGFILFNQNQRAQKLLIECKKSSNKTNNSSIVFQLALLEEDFKEQKSILENLKDDGNFYAECYLILKSVIKKINNDNNPEVCCKIAFKRLMELHMLNFSLASLILGELFTSNKIFNGDFNNLTLRIFKWVLKLEPSNNIALFESGIYYIRNGGPKMIDEGADQIYKSLQASSTSAFNIKNVSKACSIIPKLKGDNKNKIQSLLIDWIFTMQKRKIIPQIYIIVTHAKISFSFSTKYSEINLSEEGKEISNFLIEIARNGTNYLERYKKENPEVSANIHETHSDKTEAMIWNWGMDKSFSPESKVRTIFEYYKSTATKKTSEQVINAIYNLQNPVEIEIDARLGKNMEFLINHYHRISVKSATILIAFLLLGGYALHSIGSSIYKKATFYV